MADPNVKIAGKLSFHGVKGLLGSGSYGTVFRGTFEGTKDVAIKRLEKARFTGLSMAEILVPPQITVHPNVLEFFKECNEKDDDFM